MGREIKPRQINYADAIRNKNAARADMRHALLSGRLSPQKAQRHASLFHGIRSRVIRHGQGASI